MVSAVCFGGLSGGGGILRRLVIFDQNRVAGLAGLAGLTWAWA